MELGSAGIRALQKALLKWYGAHRRDLPWRRAGDPYAVWVSEVMLQQTRVSVVIDYFERWMERFPTVEHLARASEDEVLQVWQGLGYYSRARRLREGAQYVCREHRGELPRDVMALREIPGIGPYSAGAIASIAYGVRTPLVDGNVVRVLCRLFALRGDPSKAALARRLWDIAGQLVPEGRAADFNQALMELGATVCTPRHPRCGECPVRRSCRALAEDLVDVLPETAPRAEVTPVESAAALVARGGRWLVVQLPADARRWPGMWTFPTVELDSGESPSGGARRATQHWAGLDAEPGQTLASLRHQVTRFRITLHAVICERPQGRARAAAAAAVAWKRPEELPGLAMPAPQRRLARLLQSERTAIEA